MRKILFLFFIVFMSSIAWSKDRKPSYFETNDTSPDSLMANCKVTTDGGRYFITFVDTINGKSAQELYTKAKEWIGTSYSNPESIIKSDVQNSQIVIYAQLSKIISGRMTLKFREGRYRLEIEDMNLYVSPDMVKFVKPRPIEYSPRYIIERGERSQKWLLADLYETLKGIKEKLEGNNTEDNW